MLTNCVNKLSHKTQTAMEDSYIEIIVEKILISSNDVSII